MKESRSGRRKGDKRIPADAMPFAANPAPYAAGGPGLVQLNTSELWVKPFFVIVMTIESHF